MVAEKAGGASAEPPRGDLQSWDGLDAALEAKEREVEEHRKALYNLRRRRIELQQQQDTKDKELLDLSK
jgi:hypothetical protein